MEERSVHNTNIQDIFFKKIIQLQNPQCQKQNKRYTTRHDTVYIH